MRTSILLLITLLAGSACIVRDDEDANAEAAREAPAQDGTVATVYASGSDRLDPQQLEAERMQMDWREWVERDTAAGGAAPGAAAQRNTAGGAQPRASGNSPAASERWEDITPQSVNSGAVALPVSGDVKGPSALRVQILLDRAFFSPGILDGRWGRNTEKAVYWLQRREGLPATGAVDQQTWQRLIQLSGQPQQLVRTHQLTQDDVAGPFKDLPEDYYERRNLDCQCYESLAEKLAERFHATEDLLRQLNPNVDLNTVTAGTTLNVPAVDDRRAPTGTAGNVARIVISDGGRYLHGLDASGRILYHFPATLGSDYSPSPSGDYRVTNVAHDPSWHYQPKLLEGVSDDKPDAVLPPGPNNAVGVVWMQLSKEHYGIHGTSSPETIGYTTSNGCVRLTNWDAEFLAHRVAPGTPVEFRDVRGEGGATTTSPS